MNRVLYTSFLLGAGLTCIKGQTNTPPNIVLIFHVMTWVFPTWVVTEVKSGPPNIDSLAENGVRFSLFKNTGRSCPSRAALLTGHYQHEAGMGWMTAVDEHRPG